ncbi:helix-turn-helix domain-containing protein [Ligilactobacillus animalis]|nr:helix-turn-helix domain-containing protein [Ligilactobacillus animalis]
MARIKKLRQKNFTIVDNTVIDDTELSWKAKGVFLYLWSKSDEWQFYEVEVAKHAKDGRDSLRSALKELEAKGYLKRARDRNDKGQVTTSDWILSEKPMLENPTQEKPMQENDTLPSTDLTKDLSNQELSKIDRQIDSVGVIGDFIDFWEMNLGFMAPLIQEDFLYEYQDWREKGVAHDEIIAIFKEALSKTISYNANNKRKYTLGILHGWLNTNTLSLNAIKGEEKQFKKQQEKKQQRNSIGYNNSYTNKSNEAW